MDWDEGAARHAHDPVTEQQMNYYSAQHSALDYDPPAAHQPLRRRGQQSTRHRSRVQRFVEHLIQRYPNSLYPHHNQVPRLFVSSDHAADLPDFEERDGQTETPYYGEAYSLSAFLTASLEQARAMSAGASQMPPQVSQHVLLHQTNRCDEQTGYVAVQPWQTAPSNIHRATAPVVRRCRMTTFSKGTADGIDSDPSRSGRGTKETPPPLGRITPTATTLRAMARTKGAQHRLPDSNPTEREQENPPDENSPRKATTLSETPSPRPLFDIPSGWCSFTGPWTVTRSSLHMLRWVAAFCRPLQPVLLLVSFPRSRSPVVGVLGLC